MNVMVYQELFEHFPRRDEEITVTSLATEFEGVFRGRFSAAVAVQCTVLLEVWAYRDL